MTKIVACLSALIIFLGFSALGQLRAESFAPPGRPVAEVGSVKVFRILKYGGRLAEEQLVVNVDEHGHAILVIGEGSSEEIAVYFTAAAGQALVAGLRSLTATPDGQPEPQQTPVNIMIAGLSLGSSNISLNYGWDAAGKGWWHSLDLWGYDLFTSTTPQLAQPTARYGRVLLTPSGLVQLLRLTEQAQGSPPQR
jgi:hypothetical protein